MRLWGSGAEHSMRSTCRELLLPLSHARQRLSCLLYCGVINALAVAGIKVQLPAGGWPTARAHSAAHTRCPPNPAAGTGWPSFYDALPDSVALESDYSIAFMPRIEVGPCAAALLLRCCRRAGATLAPHCSLPCCLPWLAAQSTLRGLDHM